MATRATCTVGGQPVTFGTGATPPAPPTPGNVYVQQGGNVWVKGASGWVDTGTAMVTVPGPQGIQGQPGPRGLPGQDSTVPGPVGPVSTVPGPRGLPGQDSTVPGPPGPPGQPGAASTVPGPPGQDSTVPGPRGQKGDKGDKGDDGPRGHNGTPGAASTLPGPQGIPGIQGQPGRDGADGDKITAITGPVYDTTARAWVINVEVTDATNTTTDIPVPLPPLGRAPMFKGTVDQRNTPSASLPDPLIAAGLGIQEGDTMILVDPTGVAIMHAYDRSGLTAGWLPLGVPNAQVLVP